MKNHTHSWKLKTLLVMLLLLTLACNNLEALSGLRDYLNTNVPEETPLPVDTQVPPEESLTKPVEPRFYVIWDDDGSPDGMVALMYFLHNPDVKVEALLVSSGEAYPHQFAPLLKRMLVKINRDAIPIGAGSETPLVGNNAFPDPWRVATSEFWNIELPEIPDQVDARDAAEVIIEVVNASPQPITYFVSGTHTNLAEALRLDPSIKENIASIHVMGGALFVPGNIASDWAQGTNETAEWNIYVDPVAAQKVFTSGIPIYLTPLDATNQVVFERLDASAWRNSGPPEGELAADLLSWMLSSWFEAGVYVWDLVTAVNLTHPEYCQSDDYYAEVISEQGADEGRTVVIDGEAPNLNACLEPDSTSIKQHIKDVFKN